MNDEQYYQSLLQAMDQKNQRLKSLTGQTVLQQKHNQMPQSFQNFQQYLAQQYSNDGGAKHLNPYAQAQILHEQKNSINSNLSNNNRRPTSSSNQSQSQNSTQLPELQNSNAKLSAIQQLNNIDVKRVQTQKFISQQQHQQFNLQQQNSSRKSAQERSTIEQIQQNYQMQSNPSQQQNQRMSNIPNNNNFKGNNPPPKEVLMSDQEKTNFGNRCPTGYKKIKILGKGGIAVVWLGQKNGEQVAMKQFPKQGNQCDSSAIVELQISRLIKNAKDTRGQEHIAKLLDSVEDKKDLWLIYELCKGRSLNEQLFEVKGEFYKGERIYKVNINLRFHACSDHNFPIIYFTIVTIQTHKIKFLQIIFLMELFFNIKNLYFIFHYIINQFFNYFFIQTLHYFIKKYFFKIFSFIKLIKIYEQVFGIQNHWSLYHSIRNTLPLIKDFVIRMSEALSLFNRLGIVHADLKPDNILIDFDDSIQEIKSLKIIDFGSAFMLSSDGKSLKDQREFAMSTPEYLPPEIQQYLARKFTTQNNYEISDFSQCPFVFDIWSLGSILLEILTGFPIWLSLKSRVKSLDGRHLINYGIFGVQGRDNQKILQKQITVLSNGMANMKKQIKKGFDTTSNLLFDNQEFIDILGSMLDWNPGTRISPEEVLSHKFLGKNKQQLNQVVQLEDE